MSELLGDSEPVGVVRHMIVAKIMSISSLPYIAERPKASARYPKVNWPITLPIFAEALTNPS